MNKTISRDDLYALVWSEPLRTLASKFEISDVALRKACQRAAVPTPERGYWAKLEAGKSVVKAALPLRPPGLNHEVPFGEHRRWYHSWTREEILGPIPPAPHFDESLEAVRARIEAGLGPVACPAKGRALHPGIQRLMDQEEVRKQKAAASAYPFSWEKPRFTTAPEQRRLKILNSLFLAVGKFGGKASIRGGEARDLAITFHQQHVGISLEIAKPTGKTADRLSLSILQSVSSSQARATWTDNEQSRLEDQLTTIAAEIVLAAEIQLREGATRLHEWRIERKAQAEEEERKQRIEQLRLEQERLERVEQARVGGLLEAADAFRRAQEIRTYVEKLGTRIDPNDAARRAQYRDWAKWASAQADRIDPALKSDFAGFAEAPSD